MTLFDIADLAVVVSTIWYKQVQKREGKRVGGLRNKPWEVI